ncbi:MAG: hypothetical protein O9248_01845 [Rhodobacteraceae bacterium]|nr:hypothetical protein [Paracoccaceae bacterium]
MKLDEWSVNFRWLLFGAFGLVSIPSAYLFGLTVPMGGGMAIFLDLTFYSTEAFKLLLFLAGFSAFLRPLLLVMVASSSDSQVTKDVASDSKYWRVATGFVKVGLFFLLPILSLLSVIFGFQLSISFLMTLSMPILICLSFYSAFAGVPLRTFGDFFRFIQKSTDLKNYIADPLLFFANVTMAMVIALAGGYYRTFSLAVADTFCVMTKNGTIQAAPVARTDAGMVFAQNVEGRWMPIAFPISVALVQSDIFVFIYNSEIQAMSMKCDAFPNASFG